MKEQREEESQEGIKQAAITEDSQRTEMEGSFANRPGVLVSSSSMKRVLPAGCSPAIDELWDWIPHWYTEPIYLKILYIKPTVAIMETFQQMK